MQEIKINDLRKALYGEIHFRFSINQELGDDEYFTCLEKIKPLLQDPDFESSTPGFYINFIRGSLRLCYYTIDVSKTKQIKETFLNKNPEIKIFYSNEPNETQVLKECDDGDLKFRNFLSTYTQIGLNLLDHSIPETRGLVAEYRLRRPILEANYNKPFSKSFFGPYFSEHSDFFNRISSSNIEQLWKDLDYWDAVRRQPWDHYLVNMLLPYDGLVQKVSRRVF